MKGRVLVTGASGFGGERLASHLVSRGVEVHGVVRPGRERGLPSGVVPAFADLTDPGAVSALVPSRRPEIVFHLAAPFNDFTESFVQHSTFGVIDKGLRRDRFV